MRLKRALPMDQHPPKRQQMKSCNTCRRRKVRCESVNNDPCTNCRKSGASCRFNSDWKRPVRSKGVHRRAPNHSPTTERRNRISTADSSPSPSEGVRAPYDAPPNADGLRNNVTISQGLARTSLPQFFQHGINPSTWAVFDVSELMRIVYVGTDVSNLSHLINLERQGQGGRGVNVPLHLPYPPIHPTLPWKPELDQSPFGSQPRADQVQDLSSFPAKEVRDSLVDAFFDHINPTFPVVDELQFRRQYADSSNPPALILLQSVLLAGAHVCSHSKVVQSRPMVKTALFRRAKALFDMRHENDRLHLVQSALLFTWHLENADTASANSYYWAGVACRIAFGIGMHRDLSSQRRASVLMPICDRRIYRRVWWTLFQTEIFTALESGRPSMIHLDEIDQAPLDLDDFKEENGIINEKLKLDYCVQNIDLCYLVLEILRLNKPGIARQGASLHSSLTSLDSRLISWILKNPASDDFWSLQLQMHYLTVLIHLHRKFMTETSRANQQSQSAELCNRAASAITAVLETMLTKQTLGQCYFTSVIALTATAIHISGQIRHTLEHGSTLLALNSLNELERLFIPAKELSLYWPNAEAVLKLFQNLSEKFRGRILEMLGTGAQPQPALGGGLQDHGQGQQSPGGEANGQRPFLSDGNVDTNSMIYTIDWQDILSYPLMQPQHQQQYFIGDEDWMNVSPEVGMGM